MSYRPPVCPGCKARLDDVSIRTEDIWKFHPEEGNYERSHQAEDSTTAVCAYCNTSLDELFTNGIIPYRGEKI